MSRSAGGWPPSPWGRGYATEAARAALDHAFLTLGLAEILAYTGPDNHRSQAVMRRLGLRRDPSRDFTADYDLIGPWRGLVWTAAPGRAAAARATTAQPSP